MVDLYGRNQAALQRKKERRQRREQEQLSPSAPVQPAFSKASSSYAKGLPSRLTIGDVLLRAPEKPGRGVRPVIVWAIYRDQQKRVRAVEVLNPRSFEPGRRDIDTLYIKADDVMRKAALKRPSRISMSDISLLPYTAEGDHPAFLPTRRDGAKMSRDFIPDLLIRRSHALAHTPKHFSSSACAVERSWVREGYYFTDMTPGHVLSGVQAPEIDPGCRIKPAQDGGFTQDIVNALARWSEHHFRCYNEEFPPPLECGRWGHDDWLLAPVERDEYEDIDVMAADWSFTPA